MCCSKWNIRVPARRAGFTLVEVAVAIVVLATLSTSVLVIFDRCITAVIDLQGRTIAFETARENMEQILASDYVVEKVEFGVHPLHQDIEWQTAVEHFNEPITNRMWIRAVCSASYLDARSERQTIELTHWITDLSDRQAQAILEQDEKMQEYMDLLGDNEDYLTEQRAIRRYLAEMGMDVQGYDELLLRQKQQKEQWIAENDFDPDAFQRFLMELQDEESQWLVDRGLSMAAYDAWKWANPQYFTSPADSGGSDGEGPDPFGPEDPLDPDPGNEPPDTDTPDGPSDDRREPDVSEPDRTPGETGISPQLRQRIKKELGWSDEMIDSIFGPGR